MSKKKRKNISPNATITTSFASQAPDATSQLKTATVEQATETSPVLVEPAAVLADAQSPSVPGETASALTQIYSPTWSEELGRWTLRYQWPLFGLIMGLATFLRLVRLDYRSIWYDESFSLTLASRDLPTILTGTANDYHPPLPYLLLGGWTRLLGDSVYSGRVLSALFGLAFVAAVYGLGREMFGSRTALLAALFATVAPFQVLYSQEVRHYSLQALLGTLVLWAFYRAWRRNTTWAWSLYALAAVLSLYNLYFSLFGLMALNLFYLGLSFARWRTGGWQWRKSAGWLGANLAVGLLFAPWAWTLVGQVGQVKKSYWISTPNPLEALRLTNVLLLNATELTIEPPWPLVGLLLGTLATLFVLNALRFRLRRGDRGRRRRSFEILLLAAYWLGAVGIVLALSYLFTPIYLERSLLGVSAPLYLLLGRVMQTARRPALWLFLLVPGLIVLVASLNSYYFSRFYTTHYENEGAVATLREGYRASDLVLHTNKLSYLPFRYLKAPGPQYLAPEEPGNIHDDLSAQTLKALDMTYTPLDRLPPARRVWLVRGNPQPGQTEAYLDNLQAGLTARYAEIARFQFWGETLYLYEARA